MSATTATPPPRFLFTLRQWLVLLLVQVTTLTFGMTITATNVVLPQMRGALSATQDQIAWIVTLFLVAAAVGTPLTGWLSACLGWRRLMVGALLGFSIASWLCGLCNSLETLIVARVAQGFFGAPLMPLGQGILLASFPRHRHPLVLMMWGVGGVMGPVLGPLLGGFVAQWLDWRWVFFMVVPIGLASVALAAVALGDTERGSAGKLDFIGFVALAVCMCTLQLILDRGHRLDWFDSPEIVIEALLAGVSLWVFVTHTLTAHTPFFDPALFRNWNFVLGLLMAFLMGALSYTPIVLFPPLLQDLRAYPESVIGYLMSARGLGNFLSFLVVVQATRYSARLTLAAGLLLQAVAGWDMARLDINLGDQDVFWPNLLQGFGFGLAYTPMTALAFSTLDSRLIIQGSAMFNLLRNFGSSLFISLSVLVLVRSTAQNYAGLSVLVSPVNEVMRNSAIAGSWTFGSVPGLNALSAEIQRQSAMGGYLNAFYLFTITAAMAIPLVFMFRQERPRID